MEQADQIQVRAATDDDTSFIYASWLNHCRNSSHLTWHIANDLFFSEWKERVTAALARSQVYVVCLTDSPDMICGYAVVEHADIPILHFCYVKKSLRNQGVARVLWTAAGLSKEAPVIVSCATQDFIKGLLPKLSNVTYNPFLFLGDTNV